ncbi:hypothetical protein M5689_003133 [Euphorbia peplus]|nr:hypothetical protein M5689_003133 [Euphorbia peplus]
MEPRNWVVGPDEQCDETGRPTPSRWCGWFVEAAVAVGLVVRRPDVGEPGTMAGRDAVEPTGSGEATTGTAGVGWTEPTEAETGRRDDEEAVKADSGE